MKSPSSSNSSKDDGGYGNQTKIAVSSKSHSTSPDLLSPKMLKNGKKNKLENQSNLAQSKEPSIDYIIQDLAKFNEYGESLKT